MTKLYPSMWRHEMTNQMINLASHLVASTRFAVAMKQCGRKDDGGGP